MVLWNSASDLPRCIASLVAQDWPTVELVLVDNASRDGSLAFARHAWPATRGPLRWHRNADNLGFAAACNQGMELSSGALVLWLNPDTASAPDLLRELVEGLDRHGAGIGVPRIELDDDPVHIDNTGQGIARDGLNWCRGRGRPGEAPDDPEGPVLLPSGACVLWRREVLERVGLLDPAFFAYGEDAELGLRAARQGFQTVYLPRARLRHRLSASWGLFSLRKVWLVERNRWRIAVAHLPADWLLLAPATATLRLALTAGRGLAGQGVAAQVPGGRRELLPLIVGSAWLAAAVGLPRALMRRREESRRASLSATAWRRRLLEDLVPIGEIAASQR